jgi:hypothetical protein
MNRTRVVGDSNDVCENETGTCFHIVSISCVRKKCNASRENRFSETKFVSSDSVTCVDASHTFSGSS